MIRTFCPVMSYHSLFISRGLNPQKFLLLFHTLPHSWWDYFVCLFVCLFKTLFFFPIWEAWDPVCIFRNHTLQIVISCLPFIVWLPYAEPQISWASMHQSVTTAATSWTHKGQSYKKAEKLTSFFLWLQLRMISRNRYWEMHQHTVDALA